MTSTFPLFLLFYPIVTVSCRIGSYHSTEKARSFRTPWLHLAPGTVQTPWLWGCGLWGPQKKQILLSRCLPKNMYVCIYASPASLRTHPGSCFIECFLSPPGIKSPPLSPRGYSPIDFCGERSFLLSCLISCPGKQENGALSSRDPTKIRDGWWWCGLWERSKSM